MGVVEELIGVKCPKCHKKLKAETDFMAVGVDTALKGVIVPGIAAYFGLSSVRPSYLVCTNKKCEYCYSAQRPFFLKINLLGKVVPVLHLGDKDPEPKKKKFKLF